MFLRTLPRLPSLLIQQHSLLRASIYFLSLFPPWQGSPLSCSTCIQVSMVSQNSWSIHWRTLLIQPPWSMDANARLPCQRPWPEWLVQRCSCNPTQTKAGLGQAFHGWWGMILSLPLNWEVWGCGSLTLHREGKLGVQPVHRSTK